MIAELSDELARELDRSGGPLTVEDPRTHKRYVIVAADEYALACTASTPTATHSGWTEEKNARRFKLIDKEMAGTLRPAEAAELANLQREVDAYLDRVAPLPLEAVRKLHARLLKQSQERLPS